MERVVLVIFLSISIMVNILLVVTLFHIEEKMREDLNSGILERFHTTYKVIEIK